MIPLEDNESPQCPVCQARFRGSETCSRCGADLGPLMRLAAKAYHLREDARQALRAEQWGRAGNLAAEAQATCSTQKGEGLRRLSAWLASLTSGA